MNRILRLGLPLVPPGAALYLAHAPVPSFGLGNYADVLTYLSLRTEAFFVLFYDGTVACLAVAVVNRDRAAGILGALMGGVPLFLVFGWTSHAYAIFTLLPMSDDMEITAGGNLVPAAAVGLLFLSALNASATTKEWLVAPLRFVEAASLGLMTLGVLVYAFDRSEFYLHATNLALESIQNATMVEIGVPTLMICLVLEMLARRHNRTVGSSKHKPGRV
jgi:hypothetical protein